MKKVVLLFAVSLVAFAGCQNTQTDRAPYGGETRIDTFTGVGVNISGRLNEDLTLDPAPFVGKFLPNQDVLISAVTAAPNAQGFPQIQFAIQNEKGKGQAFQYRLVWLDAAGFVVQPDQGPWQTLHLEGREVGYIGSTARSPAARSFQLTVRPLEFKK